jgi:hypothetical protein
VPRGAMIGVQQVYFGVCLKICAEKLREVVDVGLSLRGFKTWDFRGCLGLGPSHDRERPSKMNHDQ